MSNSVARVTTITARSEKGFDDAIAAGIARSNATLRNVMGAWVKDQKVEVADGIAMARGSLAGSVLTMDRAVANLQRFTGSSLGTAVRLASHNPAKLLGMEDVIANHIAGQPADFNVFNAAGELQATLLKGTRIQSSI